MKTKLKVDVESLYFTVEEWRALEEFEDGIERVCKELECEECPFRNHILCELRRLTKTIDDDFHVVLVEDSVEPKEEI